MAHGYGWIAIQGLLAAHGGVVTRCELVGDGVTDASIRWALNCRRLVALRRGVFVDGRLWACALPVARHHLQLRAAQRVQPDQVAAGVSAAALWGLPLPDGVPPLPSLTVRRGTALEGAVGTRGSTTQRRSWLSDDDVVVSQGIVATSPLRTLVDCCRLFGDPWALAIGDAAARDHAVTAAALRDWFRRTPPVPGKRRARWVAEHLDVHVESPLESLPRALILRAGLPKPVTQHPVSTHRGDYRVDLADVRYRVVVEADGRDKYERPQDLWDEKRREDAIRDAGYEVVRFVMADLSRAEAWLDGYKDAVVRSARRLGFAPPIVARRRNSWANNSN